MLRSYGRPQTACIRQEPAAGRRYTKPAHACKEKAGAYIYTITSASLRYMCAPSRYFLLYGCIAFGRSTNSHTGRIIHASPQMYNGQKLKQRRCTGGTSSATAARSRSPRYALRILPDATDIREPSFCILPDAPAVIRPPLRSGVCHSSVACILRDCCWLLY